MISSCQRYFAYWMTQIEIISTIRPCRTLVLISCTASNKGLPLFSRKHGYSIAVKIFCKQPFNRARWHFYTKTRSVSSRQYLPNAGAAETISVLHDDVKLIHPLSLYHRAEIGGKITTLVHYRRAGGWVTQGKEGKEVEEWWERRRAGGETLVQGTEGKARQKGRRAGNVKSTHKYRAPPTYNHSNQGP